MFKIWKTSVNSAGVGHGDDDDDKVLQVYSTNVLTWQLNSFFT